MSAYTVTQTLNIFPATPKYAWTITKTPLWKTIIQTTASDLESVCGLVSYPRYQWELSYKLLKSDASVQLQTIIGFYNGQNGPVIPFLFSDPNDNAAVTQNFGTGDGVSTKFQLYRWVGGDSDPVFAPYGGIYVYKAGTEQANTNFSVSTAGLVTFNSAPANGAALTWTGTYYWLVRFLDDSYDFQYFAPSKWKMDKIVLISKKYNSLGNLV